MLDFTKKAVDLKDNEKTVDIAKSSTKYVIHVTSLPCSNFNVGVKSNFDEIRQVLKKHIFL